MMSLPGTSSLAGRLVRLGRLSFADFALLDPAALRAALGTVDPALLVPLLIRHPAVLRRFLRACPEPVLPRGVADEPQFAAALIHRHAFDLLAAKSPALYETLPWLDWDFSIVSRRWPLWRTRLLVAGDSSSIVAARGRRAAGVIVVEPRPALADYARRKARLSAVRSFAVMPGPLADVLAGGGFDAAILSLPLDGDTPGLLACLACPALLLALRPGAEADVTVPAGWTGTSVATASGPRPAWLSPGT
jgi:hypothetical protein